MKRASKGKLQGGDGWTLVRSCPRCGKPELECRCNVGAAEVPARAATIRLRLEKRNGKSVTVLSATGLSPDSLANLLRELKDLCAAGGIVKGAEAELQGDHREKVRAVLSARGMRVKG